VASGPTAFGVTTTSTAEWTSGGRTPHLPVAGFVPVGAQVCEFPRHSTSPGVGRAARLTVSPRRDALGGGTVATR